MRISSNETVCRSVDPKDLAPGMVEGLIYNSFLEKFVVVGIADDPALREPYFGVYYSTSDDLIDWSPRRLLLEIPVGASVEDNTNDLYFAYPTLIDHEDTSLTFDSSDESMYLYISRFNAGGNSLDRDVLRYPIEIVPTTFERPKWEFNTDGDVEGWLPEIDLEGMDALDGTLSFRSSGEDPILHSPPFEIPAADFKRLSIRMKVSPGEPTVGQVFFLTNNDTKINEEKSVTFEIIDDGEFHTYDLDMAGLVTWQGLIRLIRLDPVTIADRAIEIDQIEFGSE